MAEEERRYLPKLREKQDPLERVLCVSALRPQPCALGFIWTEALEKI